MNKEYLSKINKDIIDITNIGMSIINTQKSMLRMINDLDRRIKRIELEFDAHMEGHV